MEPAWRLIGRDVEQARLEAFVAGTSSPAALLVSGDAGVGKTALMAEVADAHAATWIMGNRSTRDVPLAAFTDWLATPPSEAAPATVLRQTLDAFVAGIADDNPVRTLAPGNDSKRSVPIVAVDDAHLLDTLSALLIQRVVLGGHARVLLTARAATALPEAIAHLIHTGRGERLALGPLGDDDIAELLADVLGHPVETHSLRRIIATTGGGTQYLRELVASEVAGGGLRLEHGRWYWSAMTRVPTSVIDLVLDRIDNAEDDVREVCDLLALSGPLDVATIEALTSADAVKLSEASHLCVSDRRGRTGDVSIRLRHPLTDDALRGAMSPARKYALGKRLATALATHGVGATDDRLLLQRAILCVEAGVPVDVDLLIAGSRAAAAWHDFALSERLARAATDADGGFDAKVLLGGALFRLGRLDEASKICRSLADGADNDLERVAAGTLLACIEFWGLTDPPTGLDRIAQVSGPQVNPTLASFPKALGACFAFFAGDPAVAREAAGDLLDDPSIPNGSRLWAAAAATITAGLRGRVTDALASAHIGHATIESLRGDGFVRLPVGYGEVFALGLAGRLHDASRRARDLEECTQAAGGVEMSAAGSFFRGQVAWWLGDLPAARNHLTDALAELATFAPGAWEDQVLSAYAPTLAALGELDAATTAIARLDDASRVHFAGVAPMAELARAWVAAASGRTAEAAKHVEAGCARAAESDQLAVEIVILHAATRWGGPIDLARLHDLVAQVEGPLGALALAHGDALAARDGDALDDVAAGWSRIGRLGSAADAAAQAAKLHHRDGSSAAAHASSRLARTIAGRTGARTPALVALSLPDDLTRREAQIASMAAQGLTNAEIASELFISVRTVEGHLNRIYAKLHVAGRGELIDLLGEPVDA